MCSLAVSFNLAQMPLAAYCQTAVTCCLFFCSFFNIFIKKLVSYRYTSYICITKSNK